ncbi:hypothetical protein DC094_12290 [Pelagibaculum spongiae]|uniref:Peptidase S26 domain-containing protein n=1 Tax=Pelagibaculum spongiae TaxID=2080658 RepID=A0A2V1H287_9GAMM|nr:hypothetical protein DC094_12290 [Pelagibaculum spongiae]
MLGDNRNNSLDSRSFGWVDAQLVKGKAKQIWFNFQKSDRNQAL